ncbi:MAG: sulfotransferase [Pirellulales bacterium]|nr:sulfotransferase [Pirellulales bacterium]
MISDEKLGVLFDEVAKQVRSSVNQSRWSIVRDSRRRLRDDDTDVAAIHVIAAASLLDRRAERSLSILQGKPAALSGNATGHRLAGYACLVEDRVDAAAEHFGQAVRIDPCQFDSWIMLGGIEEKSGQQEQAISYYRRALVFDDQSHDSVMALCRLYTARMDLRSAIDTLRVALFRDQRSAKLNLMLARLLERRAQLLRRNRKWIFHDRVLQEAARCYQIAAAVAPRAEVYISLGLLEQRLGHHDASVDAFERATRLNPNSVLAITNLANAHVDNGELEQACRYYQRALQIDPGHAGTHFRYSRAQKFKPDATTVAYSEQLRALASDRSRTRREQIHFNFALAKVLDDLGCHDLAWQHYDRANRLKPRRTGNSKAASPTSLDGVTDQLRRVYTAEFFQSKAGLGNPSKMPIFVVGMPRSGTTLTEQILSAHGSITGAGELKQIDRIRQQMVQEIQPCDGRGGSPQQSVQVESDPADWSDRCQYPQLMRTIDDCRLRYFADRHLRYLETLREGGTRVTDKMPTNFLHLGLIALLYPNATVIHCRRDPMDVLVSCYCQNLNVPFCDLGALVSYHREYRRLMRYWEKVLPLKIHSVDYEALVTDPESNVRAMIEHCGLDWDQRCLNFHSNRRAVRTPSKWQVRQPLYSSSVGRWRRFASHLEPIASQLTQELEKEKAIPC